MYFFAAAIADNNFGSTEKVKRNPLPTPRPYP